MELNESTDSPSTEDIKVQMYWYNNLQHYYFNKPKIQEVKLIKTIYDYLYTELCVVYFLRLYYDSL